MLILDFSPLNVMLLMTTFKAKLVPAITPMQIYRCTTDVARKDKINPSEVIIPPISATFLISNVDISIPVKIPVGDKF